MIDEKEKEKDKVKHPVLSSTVLKTSGAWWTVSIANNRVFFRLTFPSVPSGTYLIYPLPLIVTHTH